jgi:hypothetical protein
MERCSNITYVASSELLSVNFDLKPFINDAIPRLTISDSDYLHDVIAASEYGRQERDCRAAVSALS